MVHHHIATHPPDPRNALAETQGKMWLDTPATAVIYATALLTQEGLGGSFSLEETVVLMLIL